MIDHCIKQELQKMIYDRFTKNNKIPKVYIETFGCQMNVHDSERLLGAALQVGYVECYKIDEADLILLNTCCIREHAEVKVFAYLGTLKKLKQSNLHLKIGVCGCMTQQEGMARELRIRFPHVDMIFGTHNSHAFPQILLKALQEDGRIIDVWKDGGEIIENAEYARNNGIRAWVNITFGCNNYCSYCIVPYVRGRERSRTPEAIIKEIKALVDEGYQEIYLLGQNVNSYGQDLTPPVSFATLLKEVDQTGMKRVRFMTSHPKDLSDELIDTMATCQSICNSIHLPVQSGSNRILNAMNRKYTREDYLLLVEKLRNKIPDITLTTDIIVGFPGEREEDFEDTLRLMKEVRFESIYSFKYSKRTGTPAATMEGQIPLEIKSERLQRLNQLVKSISIKDMEHYIGKKVEVLMEGYHKKSKEYQVGRTTNNKWVQVRSDEDLTGQIITAEIYKAFNSAIRGKIVE